MRIRDYIISVAAMLMLDGCSEVITPVGSTQIVIEGWIEADRHPIVMVTTTVPINAEVTDESELEEYLVKWAKVTISDGERETVLTGKPNKDYFPPYIYTTAGMKGEAGKSYTVKVEYSGRTVTAETTIPEPVELEYIKVCTSESNHEAFYLVGGLRDNPQSMDYYKVFTMVQSQDSTYSSAFMGLIDDSALALPEDEIAINNSLRSKSNGSTYFSAEDRIRVRFCTLDETSYNYWNDFDEVTALSRNPFFPVTTKIRSNVSGGLGYWAGYGSVYYTVSIPDSLALGRVQ